MNNTKTDRYEFLNPFTLRVYDLNNNMHPVTCYGDTNTISYVKFILSSDIKINPNEILLYYKDSPLNDTKTLGSYGINKHSELRMFYKLKTSC